MPVINVLQPHVADMIAAGEVVERPASVIKELVENSLDAGAKNITVEIRGGGATYIRVTDDGCGMAPEDAGIAFLRHATSKLHDEKGLEAISTMGFRGEALAAISSVSKIELNTRRRGDASGTRVVLEAGDIQEMFAAGCPDGTTMTVRDLFYNTPARLKFLKSDRSEASACQLAALRCALGHPEVSIRFIKDRNEEFFTPGDGKQESCVYSLMGRDMATQMLRCTGENNGIRVTGFVSSPAYGKGNRSAQFFFCNGRFIKSQLLQAAVEQAYKNTLLTGRYPACALYIELGYGSVDVNVHPAKTEVKFSEERKVFDAVHYTVKDLLTAGETPKPVQQTFYQSMTVREYRERQTPPPAEKRPLGSYSARPAVDPDAKLPIRDSVHRPAPLPTRDPQPAQARPAPVKAPVPAETIARTEPSAPALVPAEERPAPAEVPVSAPRRNTIDLPIQQTLTEKPAPWRMVGEALDTYIICQDESENLWLIDKHAAHERLRFNALKERQEPPMSQLLLQPLAVDLEADAYAAALASLPLLEELGFSCEDFGAGTLLVREVPADICPEDAAATIEELAEGLRLGRADPAAARDHLLQTMACKSAIKAGMHTSPAELRALVDRVQSGEIQYCPHGRPVAVKLTRYEIEKMFKRA